MKYYPANLDINNRKCLVIGGGGVGTRKVKTLINCGAVVYLVSLKSTDELLRLSSQKKIILKERAYKSSDLDGKFLVIGATNNQELNKKISKDAEKRNMLCNIADVPDKCNFILPAIVDRGDLVISISTSGKSPAFAKKLRKDLEKQFGDEYTDFLRFMGAVRQRLLSEKHEPEAHKHLFESLINGGLPDLIKNNQIEYIDRLLLEVLGKGFCFDELMMDSHDNKTNGK